MSFADIAIVIGADRHDAALHKLRNEPLDSRANCDQRLINFKHNDGV